MLIVGIVLTNIVIAVLLDGEGERLAGEAGEGEGDGREGEGERAWGAGQYCRQGAVEGEGGRFAFSPIRAHSEFISTVAREKAEKEAEIKKLEDVGRMALVAGPLDDLLLSVRVWGQELSIESLGSRV